MDKPSPAEPVSEQQQEEAETASKLETIQALFRDFDEKAAKHEEIDADILKKLTSAITRTSLHDAGVDDQSNEVAFIEKENARIQFLSKAGKLDWDTCMRTLLEISKTVRSLHTSAVSGLAEPDDADAQKVAQKQDPQDAQPAQAKRVDPKAAAEAYRTGRADPDYNPAGDETETDSDAPIVNLTGDPDSDVEPIMKPKKPKARPGPSPFEPRTTEDLLTAQQTQQLGTFKPGAYQPGAILDIPATYSSMISYLARRRKTTTTKLGASLGLKNWSAQARGKRSEAKLPTVGAGAFNDRVALFGTQWSGQKGALSVDDDMFSHFGPNVLASLEGPLVKGYKEWASTADNPTPITAHTKWLVPKVGATKDHLPEQLVRSKWSKKRITLMQHLLNETTGFGAEITGKESFSRKSRGYVTQEWMRRFIAEFGNAKDKLAAPKNNMLENHAICRQIAHYWGTLFKTLDKKAGNLKSGESRALRGLARFEGMRGAPRPPPPAAAKKARPVSRTDVIDLVPRKRIKKVHSSKKKQTDDDGVELHAVDLTKGSPSPSPSSDLVTAAKVYLRSHRGSQRVLDGLLDEMESLVQDYNKTKKNKRNWTDLVADAQKRKKQSTREIHILQMNALWASMGRVRRAPPTPGEDPPPKLAPPPKPIQRSRALAFGAFGAGSRRGNARTLRDRFRSRGRGRVECRRSHECRLRRRRKSPRSGRRGVRGDHVSPCPPDPGRG